MTHDTRLALIASIAFSSALTGCGAFGGLGPDEITSNDGGTTDDSTSSDGFGTKTCDEIKDIDPVFWQEVCDKDGDGQDDEEDPIIIVDEQDPDDPDDDDPIIVIAPENQNDDNPDNDSFSITFSPDIEDVLAESGGVGPEATTAAAANYGCKITSAFAARLNLPAMIPGTCDSFAPTPGASCRQCLADAIDSLSWGAGTAGSCSLAQALKRSVSNRFVIAQRNSDTEPGFLHKALMVALGALSRTALRGPPVACPPDLSAVTPGQPSDDWDDSLYVGSCAGVCDSPGPKGCFGADPCGGWYYAAKQEGARFNLTSSPPSTKPPEPKPRGWKPPVIVPTLCRDEPIGGSASILLCCPNSAHEAAGDVFAGGTCGTSGSLGG